MEDQAVRIGIKIAARESGAGSRSRTCLFRAGGFSFPRRGDPLMLLLRFKAALWPGRKIWPPTAARTFSQGQEVYRT
jgi:hypothetical protein